MTDCARYKKFWNSTIQSSIMPGCKDWDFLWLQVVTQLPGGEVGDSGEDSCWNQKNVLNVDPSLVPRIWIAETRERESVMEFL